MNSQNLDTINVDDKYLQMDENAMRSGDEANTCNNMKNNTKQIILMNWMIMTIVIRLQIITKIKIKQKLKVKLNQQKIERYKHCYSNHSMVTQFD